jgi:aminoglycoside phosphotransferase (APT) family kinase protein
VLQTTPWRRSGLEGEPVITPASEVDRWAAALATVEPPFANGWERVHAELLARVPDSAEPVLTHGDYRLGNMLARGSRIEAVIDWEIWSIGDPRSDLAWFRLNTEVGVYGWSTRLGAALPPADELLGSYERAGGPPPHDLNWFDALARFKTVATWSLILKRSRKAGAADHPGVAGSLGPMLEAAHRLLT